jgi:hypothetical protein
MNLAKFSGLAILIPTLVGCGGSDSAPTTVITKDNLLAVAGEGFLDANSVVHAWIHPINDAFAPMTTPCTDGGTTLVDDLSHPPAFDVTTTYQQCAQNDTTTDGKSHIVVGQVNMKSNKVTTLNLTVTSPDFSIVETGEWTTEGDPPFQDATSKNISSDGISITLSSAAATDKLALSNVVISDVFDAFGNSLLTDSYTVESTRLGGRFRVETETTLVTALQKDFHPESGQLTILGAKGAKLVVTVLGSDTFRPPLDQGQLKLELDAGDGAAPVTVFASWNDLETASDGLEFIPGLSPTGDPQ